MYQQKFINEFKSQTIKNRERSPRMYREVALPFCVCKVLIIPFSRPYRQRKSPWKKSYCPYRQNRTQRPIRSFLSPYPHTFLTARKDSADRLWVLYGNSTCSREYICGIRLSPDVFFNEERPFQSPFPHFLPLVLKSVVFGGLPSVTRCYPPQNAWPPQNAGYREENSGFSTRITAFGGMEKGAIALTVYNFVELRARKFVVR